jgi:hypothetical protein
MKRILLGDGVVLKVLLDWERHEEAIATVFVPRSRVAAANGAVVQEALQSLA